MCVCFVCCQMQQGTALLRKSIPREAREPSHVFTTGGIGIDVVAGQHSLGPIDTVALEETSMQLWFISF